MSRLLPFVACLAWSLACAGSAPAPVPAPAEVAPADPAEPLPRLEDPRTWPRASSLAMGCMFERAGAVVDAKFRCGAPPVDEGDPCVNIEAYKAGPAFPPELSSKLPPFVSDVYLSWMAGELQDVSLHVRAGVPEASVREVLHLDAPRLENVDTMDVQKCSKDHLCVSFTGFDWVGAGDIDCDERGL